MNDEMAINEREHHIKVLEQFLHDYQEWGEVLELEKTIKYAISSLKTDLKYDLMYEGEEIYTKANMVAMLEDLKQDIIAEAYGIEMDCSDYVVNVADIDMVIQQKINVLKENDDGDK